MSYNHYLIITSIYCHYYISIIINIIVIKHIAILARPKKNDKVSLNFFFIVKYNVLQMFQRYFWLDKL